MEENNKLEESEEIKAEPKTIGFAPALLIILIIAAILGVYYFVQSKSGEVNSPVTMGASNDKTAPKMGAFAPNFTAKDLNGKSISLADYKGKVVFLNLWATWCPPCREEMPSMQKLYEQLQGQDFEILAVSIDTDGAKSVAPFMKKYGLTFPALLDPDNKVARLYQVTGVPESFILNKKGIIVKKIIGPMDWSSESALSFFYKLLKETP